MYDMNSYRKQVTRGVLDQKCGEFVTGDGKVWVSVGCIEYGNNNFFEVMVLKEKPAELSDGQWPVYLASHDGYVNELGVPLPAFLSERLDSDVHHLPNIVEQIGCALNRYTDTSECVDFDVSYEFGLDALWKDLEPLVKSEYESVLTLNPRGPAGGNTQVVLKTTNKGDLERVRDYAVAHGLKLL